MRTPKCAPGKKGIRGSCYDEKDILEIAKANNIPTKGKSPTKLWSMIRNELKHECNDERCWAEKAHPYVQARLVACFRPEHPLEWEQDPRTWLSNVDIERVMVQYETNHPEFDFLGVVPLDFAERLHDNRCVAERMCTLDVKQLAAEGKTCLGCVVNLDRHDMSGSHWVAFYISLKGKNSGTYFYDSIARSPPRPISLFLEGIVRVSRRDDPSHAFRHNTVRKQYKNSECGVFCIRFLESMLIGRRDFDKVCETMPNDDEVFELRDKYFNSYGNGRR